MKIALLGYGKMGQRVEKAALARGHSIVARFTSKEWDNKALLDADICMEFTHPAAVVENIRKVAALKKNLIIGTTGWYDKLELVRALVEEQQIGALYAPNFSLGVHLLLEIVSHAAKVVNAFEEYDVAGIEYHHNKKQDSPSGTALKIANAIEENMQRIATVPFSSIRCGAIPGTHTILFDSPADTISITHQARNGAGFAEGALQAAEWLGDRKGLYTFTDYMRGYQCNEVRLPH